MGEIEYYLQRTDSGTGLIEIFENMPMVRIYNANKMIYHQGDLAECFYFLKKGRVKIFMTSENGTQKTLSVIEKGAILGEAAFFDGRPRISSAMAVTKCEVVMVSKNMLTDMIRRNPQTAMELFKLQAQTIRMLSLQVDNMTFVSSTGRIIKYLISALETTQSNTIKVTHEEMANIVGVSRVSISKCISKLSKEGIIGTGYRHIYIQNAEKLKELADKYEK